MIYIPTLYIDVYFLINFTVDYLALYFACFIMHLKTSTVRLLISSTVGAVFACLVALFHLHLTVYITVLVLCTVIICIITPKISSLFVCVKLFISFLLLETLFGGMVSMLFSLLDERLSPYLSDSVGGVENSDILILVCVLLLTYGILRLFFILLGKSENISRCDLTVKLLDLELSLTALVDGGNLLRDPMSGSAVIIVKRRALSQLYLKYGEGALFDITSPLARRMRLLPIKGVVGEKLLYGIRPDEVSIRLGKRLLSVEAIIAIDDTDGSFDTSDALVPLSLII